MAITRNDALQFLKRLTALIRWFCRGYQFWAPSLVILIFLGSVVYLPTCQERLIRLGGMFLQLAGIATVAFQARSAQRQFPGYTLGAWLKTRPPLFRPQHRIVELTGIASGFGSGGARMTITPGPSATLEQRVVMLEQGQANLINEVGSLGSEIRKKADELSTSLKTETAAREEGDRRNEQHIKTMAVGSLPLVLWGVGYFVLGTIAGAASAELAAGLLGAPPSCWP